MAGELPVQEPDEKPGPGAGVGLMVWRDLDVLGVVAVVPVRAAALFLHGCVAPQSKVPTFSIVAPCRGEKCLAALPVRVFQQAPLAFRPTSFRRRRLSSNTTASPDWWSAR